MSFSVAIFRARLSVPLRRALLSGAVFESVYRFICFPCKSGCGSSKINEVFAPMCTTTLVQVFVPAVQGEGDQARGGALPAGLPYGLPDPGAPSSARTAGYS